MEYKNIITYTAIVVVIAVIIIGGFIILNPSNPYSNSNYSSNLGNNEEKESNKNTIFIDKNTQIFIENSSKTISESYVSTFKELKKTSDPKFEVEEKYFYHRWHKRPDTKNAMIFLPEEYDTLVEVKRIDRINKTNYYILKSKNASVYPQVLVYKNGVWKKEVPKIVTVIHGKDENGTNSTLKEESVSTTLGVEVYEACVLRVNEETGDGRIIEIHSDCPVLYRMFAKWMLYLNKGVSWVEKHNVSDPEERIMFETDWKVVDIENVNGRKCFKVVSTSKTKSIGREGKKISGEVVTYWVDVEKRILVKMERKEDNVLTEKIELTNYEKP